MKALRRNPQDRWQSMKELISALENWDSVDVAALRVDREQERGESPALGKLAHKVRLPITTGNLVVLLVIIVILLLLVILSQVAGHKVH
jgi:hypothetical protein